MRGFDERQDAFGALLYAFHKGEPTEEILERDDGFIDGVTAGAYLAPWAKWPKHEQKASLLARGKVLDIGCGAGRVALELQSRGLDVTGIDVSPLAVRLCRERGLRKARVMRITEITPRLGCFDTIVMFGNNFGLFGSPGRARWLLRRFHKCTSQGARVLAAVCDPYQTKDPAHLAYHERNRRRGRPGGQLRVRVRYRDLMTPWYDYLFVSRSELEDILRGTGWVLVRTIESGGPLYAAVLEKATVPAGRKK